MDSLHEKQSALKPGFFLTQGPRLLNERIAKAGDQWFFHS
jgi:hypothetical protein